MPLRGWMFSALTVTLVGCAAQRVATPPAPAVASSVTERPGQVVEQGVVSVASTVVKVDQKRRVVTLKKADGEEFEILVGEEVKNLPQVKRGDSVVVTYYESMAVTLRKPGEAKVGAETDEAVERAKPGEKPGGVSAETTRLVATVVGLDKRKGTVTLKGSGGKVVTVAARDPKRLEPVKVGDLIEVVYTEAVAISVETPAKR